MAAKEGRAGKIGGPIKSNPGGRLKGGATKNESHGTKFSQPQVKLPKAVQKAPYSSTTPKN